VENMMKDITKKYSIALLSPGGNDTALVAGIVSKDARKQINAAIMKKYSNVEQVGFYKYSQNSNIYTLEMAGGEFCGNATRALAYLVLNGKKEDISVRVSGTNQILQAGTTNDTNTYTYIPITKGLDAIEKLKPNVYKISLDGITHVVTFIDKKYSAEVLMDKAKAILSRTNLLTTSVAAGVMFVRKNSCGTYLLDPVVWVREIKTIFYETACASGTTALALLLAKNNRQSTIKISVRQPSKATLTALINNSSTGFISARIEGKVTLLRKEVFTL
jgi:histidine racemase